MSVVIPAHNPGPYIEPCINSLLRQTLPRDRFEVVFVDDGSTDGTSDRLKRLAAEQAHVRVIHIAASGAPGRPRNVGLGAALGEYVQFLDADDELAPRALSRLLRMAHANDSDIVLGKFASQTLNRRQDLFVRNRPSTTFAETPRLADASMGPTKLFRAAMLRDHEITFPEGWRQMEDQLFTMRAYLAARVVSILGDEPCYYFNKREDEGHISGELVDPDSHAAHLAEVLDEVDAVADPVLRLRLMARFYRLEVLARLAGEQFLEALPSHRARLFDLLQAIARTRIDESVLMSLGAIARVRSRLLVEGTVDDVVALAQRVQAFTLDARIERASWSRGRLIVGFRATLDRVADAHALTVQDRDGSILLDPAVAEDLVGPVDVGDELASVRAQVSVVDRETALEWVLPGASALELRSTGDAGGSDRIPTIAGHVEIDPQRVGPGEQALASGLWDVQIWWSGFGVNTKGPLRFEVPGRGASRPAITPALFGRPLRWAVPIADAAGSLRIAIGGVDRVPAQLDQARRRIVRDGATLAIALPIATDRVGRMLRIGLVLTGAPGAFEIPAWITGSIGTILVDAPDLPAAGVIPRGRYELGARLGADATVGVLLGAAIVRDDGRFVLLGSARASTLARARSSAAWTVITARDATRSALSTAVRRMPPWAKELARSAYGRLRA
ncbi:MAG: glycosyltransferase [Candidatus Limnocylindrales bacterium]